MLWSLACKILGLFFLLLAVLLIIRGILATRVSGFKFYLFIYLIGIFPLVISSLILLMPQADGENPALNAMLLIMIALPMMQLVEEKQQKKVRAAFPARWATWEDKVKHASPLRRFFYPTITQREKPGNRGDSDASSNKVFLTSMIFMAVVGLIALVLILLIFLSRRGF